MIDEHRYGPQPREDGFGQVRHVVLESCAITSGYGFGWKDAGIEGWSMRHSVTGCGMSFAES